MNNLPAAKEAKPQYNFPTAESINKNNAVTDTKLNLPTAEASIVSFDKSGESGEFIQKVRDNSAKIKNEAIFNVDNMSVMDTGKTSESINNYFKSIGGIAVNPVLGEVELSKSGAKSTVFHGVGNDKFIATAAIKDVIEKGDVIDHSENWKDRGYDTYIIAGKGKVNNNDSIVGVIVKSYPNRDLKNKFYLHEVIKIGDDSVSLADNPRRHVSDMEVDNSRAAVDSSLHHVSDMAENVSEAANESTPNDNIPQNGDTVNNQYMSGNVILSDNVPSYLKNAVNSIRNKTGLNVRFANAYNTDGSINNQFRGFFGDNTIVISLNATRQDLYRTVAIHELTHSIENTKQYSDIESYIINQKYGGNTESFNNDIANKISMYSQNGVTLTESGVKAEIVADSVGEYIFADDVQSIVEQDYTFGQKVYDLITDLIYRLQSKLGVGELDELKNAQRKYRMALDSVRKNGTQNTNGQYSIETIPGTNKKYVKFGRDLELGNNRKEWSANIEKYIKDNVTKNGSIAIITEDGDSIVINGRTAWKIADVQKTKKGVKVPMSDSELIVKYEAGAHIDELVEISKRSGSKNDTDDGSHDWADEWNYRTAFFEDSKGDYYRLRISVGINPVESAAYNVGSIQKRGSLRDGSSSAKNDGGALNGDTSQKIVYHDKAQESSPQTTSMEEAFKKAFGKGQFSFVTEQNPETGKFTDASGNEYESVDSVTEAQGVRILDGKDANGKAILKIDIDNPEVEAVTTSEEYKKIIENAFDIKEVKGVTLTAERAFEKAFGEYYEDFRKVVYDNLDRSKLQYMNVLDYLTKDLQENIVKRGIKKGSKDSELLQKYGEGLITQAELMTMTDNWKNVVEAERYMRKMYDALIDSVNETKKKIYPYIEEQEADLRNELAEVNRKLDLIEQGELTTAMPTSKVNKVQRAKYLENAISNMDKNSKSTLETIDRQIESVQNSLDKKINKATKAYADLENRLSNLKAKKERLQEFFELSKAKKKEQLDKLLDEYTDSDDLFLGASKKTVENLERRRNRIEEELSDESRWRGKRIPKRKDYFHHFQEFSNSILGELLNKKKNNISAELVLVSEHTKPKSKWESFAQRRRGTDTVYDAVGGYLDYIDAAAYAMTIDPNISIIRKLTQDITHETSSSNKNTHGTNNANATIQRLDALANELSGKTVSQVDRVVQDAVGRKSFRIAKNVVNRMKASAIVGNVGSAVMQLGNLPNTLGTLKYKTSIVPAIMDSWTEFRPGKNNLYDAIMNRTEAQEQSTFLRERYFDVKSQFDTGMLANAGKLGNWMLTVGDELSTRLSWNAFYREGQKLGVENPVQYADSKTRKAVGGRGLGEKSLAQQSATISAALPFTLEVSNAWQVQKDMAKDLFKGIQQGDIKTATMGVRDFLMLYTATALLSAAMEEIRGSDGGMFNPLGIIWKNLCDYFFGDDEEDEENVFLKTTREIAGNFVGSLPVGQKVAELWPENGMEIGDKKIASRSDLFGSEDPTRYGTSNLLTNAIKHPLTSFIPGGAQIRKTTDAIKVLKDGGVYDNKGNLKYPVDRNAENYAKGLLFGKSAMDETKEFYDEDRNALTADETAEYEYRVNRGENPQDVYNEIYQRKADSAVQSEANAAYSEKAAGMINEFDYGMGLELADIYREYRKDNPKASAISVPTASRELAYNSETYSLTEEQYADLQNRYNTAYYDGIKDIVNDDSLTNSEKYEQIAEVRKEVQSRVKAEFAREEFGATGFTEEETREYEYRVQQGENPQDVYSEINQRKIDSENERAANKEYSQKAEGLITEFDYGTSLELDNIYDSYAEEDPDAASLSVPSASKRFSYDGKKYNLTEEQYADLQNRYNTAYYEGIKDIVNNGSLTDAEKYKQISEIRKNVQKTVRDEFAKDVLGYTNPKAELDEYMSRGSNGTTNYKKDLYSTQNTSDAKGIGNTNYKRYINNAQNAVQSSGQTNYKRNYANKVNSNYVSGVSRDQTNYKRMYANQNSDIGFKNYSVTNYNDGSHKGMDFAVPEGTAVQSTTAGKVIEVLSLKDSYGKYVVVRDNDGNYHYYAHLSGFNCEIGDTVNRGTVIGYSGNTGNSTGPHLHYEVRSGNNYSKQIDPRNYL